MGRLLWLPEVLRAAGLTVHEVDGWKTRGSDRFGPVRGITCHATAGSRTSTDAGEIRVLLNGSSSAPPPISQLYLSRSGEWWVVASGTCYHNRIGTAGPNKGYGNDALLGIEAQHSNTLAEPWTDVQYRSYVRGVAAILRHTGWPVSRVAGHKEHQPGQKTDPTFSMSRFRADVAAVLAGDTEEDDMTPGESWALHVINYRVEGIRANRATIRVPARPDLAKQGIRDAATGFQEPNLLAVAVGADNLDEDAVVAGVLAGLPAEKIAAAIPPGLAGQVADELARRLGPDTPA